MTFQQAISDGFGKYVQFSGRSSRSAYWYWTLFSVILYVVVYAVGLAIGSLVIYYLLALALFLPSLAVGVRRLHDIGKSGWWYLIGLVPLIGSILLIIWFCQPSVAPNEYGAAPDGAAGGPVAPVV